MEQQNSKKQKRSIRRLEFEIQFYEGILKRIPHFTECMKVLAELYTQTGRHEEGLALDERLAEKHPHDATVLYNLACSYSLLGAIDKSLDALQKAIALGFTDFDYIKTDPDLSNVRKDERFLRLIPPEHRL